MSSWVFARNKSRLVSILYYISISGILIPPAIVSTIKLLKTLHVYGSYIGIIVFYIGVFMSFAIFFMTGFIKTIPLDLEEAAIIDGCNSIQVFFKIIFPLLKPILFTAGVFLVLFIWNDFIHPFYLLRSSNQWTMTMGLVYFASTYLHQMSWNLIFADVILVSLPLFIFYIFAQRKVLSGIMGGAIKG